MTTIASDGITVAADSCVTANDLRVKAPETKLQREGGYLFGIAGDISMMEPMIDWYLKGAISTKHPRHCTTTTFTFLVFLPDEVQMFNQQSDYVDKYRYPYTTGTGAQLAMGAILHGATPYEAVKCACKVDVYSAEPITTHTIPPLPKQARKTKTGRTRRATQGPAR